jgi:predicted DNA-binding transcriptional regulator YafY
MIAHVETRIMRLLRLVRLFETGARYNARELGDLCGVARRTIFRDLNVLRDCGYAITFDEVARVYSVRLSEGKVGGQLTPENKVWLVLASLTSAFHKNVDSSAQIKQAIENLCATFQDEEEIVDLARQALSGLLNHKNGSEIAASPEN